MLHNDNYHNEVTTRNTTIDFIKGCCIIFMVWGHAAGPFKHWIYLFHIAVFSLLQVYYGIIHVCQIYINVNLLLSGN